MGLCYKCAGKRSKDHKCPPEVLLAVEALWDSFSEIEPQSEDARSPAAATQLFLAISKAAVQGVHSTRAIRMQGSVMGQPVLILLDSSSSTSFISESVAAKLTGVISLPSPSQVQVTGGSCLQSPCILSQL
ncbi:unnamed protein product [Miscanthus lutarioriparius]|uniref:Uncharacterized protein n=1 Tax=Miscanthus lutarioriparius TaxID=422564 RepID=A0A811RK60_9POAL|nr:unnamed protein product [Miscanthus lutarioriparius]